VRTGRREPDPSGDAIGNRRGDTLGPLGARSRAASQTDASSGCFAFGSDVGGACGIGPRRRAAWIEGGHRCRVEKRFADGDSDRPGSSQGYDRYKTQIHRARRHRDVRGLGIGAWLGRAWSWLGIAASDAQFRRCPKPAPTNNAAKKESAPAPTNDANGDPLPESAIARFGTLRFRHGEYVRSVAFSPDGKEIATSSYDGTIRFWDPATGKELRRFPAVLNNPGKISYLADGKELLVVEGTWYESRANDDFSGIRIWDIATGQPARVLSKHRNRHDAPKVAVSPRGDRIALGYNNGFYVSVFDPQQPKRFSAGVQVEDAREITHVALSADGGRVAVSALFQQEGQIDRENQSSFVRVYDLATKKALDRYSEPNWQLLGAVLQIDHSF